MTLETLRQCSATLYFFTVFFYAAEGIFIRFDVRPGQSNPSGFEAQGDIQLWPGDYPSCNGDCQSPVDISPESIQLESIPLLEYYGYWDSDNYASTKNDGETNIIRLITDTQPHISGGPLDDNYIFEQLHFHWGPDDSVGSEHAVFGNRFSMECHLVHYKEEYGSFNNALNYEDGLAVIGFFIQGEEGEDNVLFENLSSELDVIRPVNATSEIEQFDATEWFREFALPYEYFTYNGSLTTGQFHEVVKWILYPTVIYVGSDQIEPFRHLESAHGGEITQNYRDLQPLNDREIFYAIPEFDNEV